MAKMKNADYLTRLKAAFKYAIFAVGVVVVVLVILAIFGVGVGTGGLLF